MSKIKITLIILFIIGILGALNSISNQSTVKQEKGLVNSILNVLGLTYKPEPQDARKFDYIPAKTQSELSRIASDQQSSPSAAPDQKIQPINEAPLSSPKPAPSPSPSSSPNPYNFGFSN